MSGRPRPTSSTGPSVRAATSSSPSSMVGVAQCRSSRTSSSVPSRASAVNSAATARRACSPPTAAPGAAGSRGSPTSSSFSPRSARSRSAAPGGSGRPEASRRAVVRCSRARAVSTSSLSTMPQAVRTISVTAARSRPSPYGEVRPHSTRALGSSPANRVSSWPRRVLPTPASPETRTTRGLARSDTSTRRPMSRPSSASRPTNGASSPRPSRLEPGGRSPSSSCATTGSRLPLSRSGGSARHEAIGIVARTVSRPA